MRLGRTRSYFVADLILQCIYEVASGYLCCILASPSYRKVATIWLILIGLIVGSISLAASWNSEPRWYGIALLCVWAPFVWAGYLLSGRGRAE